MNDETILSALFRGIGRIEGRIEQFTSSETLQNRRMDNIEATQTKHGERLDTLEQDKAHRAGWIAGAFAVGGLALTGLTWLGGKLATYMGWMH